MTLCVLVCALCLEAWSAWTRLWFNRPDDMSAGYKDTWSRR